MNTVTRSSMKKTDSVSNEEGGVVPPLPGMGDIEAIISKAIEAAMKVIRSEFCNLIQEMKDYVGVLEGRINDLETATELKATMNNSSELNSTVAALKEENRQTRLAANDAEQYGRRNNLRFLGICIEKEQDCRKVVVRFVNDKLNVSISDEDIEIAHPIPTKKAVQQSGNGRSSGQHIVIARFRDRNVRDSIIRERRKLKKTGFTIVDDLTNLNVELLNRLRNSKDIAKCWSWNGRVYAVLNNKPNEKFCVKPFQPIHTIGLDND